MENKKSPKARTQIADISSLGPELSEESLRFAVGGASRCTAIGTYDFVNRVCKVDGYIPDC